MVLISSEYFFPCVGIPLVISYPLISTILKQYSSPLSNLGLNCAGPLISGFFSISAVL